MNLIPAPVLNSIFNSTRSQESGRQALDEHPIASGWGDDLDVGKISAITGSIPRDECPLLNFSMSSNIKIGQWRGFCTTASAVFQKCLRREPPGGVRQWQSLKDRRIEPPVQIGTTCKSGGQFRVDDRIDENRPLSSSRAELVFRPCKPDRVGCRDVQQHVRVEKIHSSPRVRVITFSVVSPGRAAPRAYCNQLSTGRGVARLTRNVSSQPASSSTCGAGSFSMAFSISTMLLMRVIVAHRDCPRQDLNPPGNPCIVNSAESQP